jgi:hypothetical protein
MILLLFNDPHNDPGVVFPRAINIHYSSVHNVNTNALVPPAGPSTATSTLAASCRQVTASVGF